MEASSRFHDRVHGSFGRSVTLFQVAIAVSAIAALARRRVFWLVGIALGAMALGFLVAGLLASYGVIGEHAPAHETPQAAVQTGAGQFLHAVAQGYRI